MEDVVLRRAAIWCADVNGPISGVEEDGVGFLAWLKKDIRIPRSSKNAAVLETQQCCK